MHTLLSGYSETDITPSSPVQLMGFNRKDNTSQGVLAPLLAQVCIWQFKQELCCLVAIDHIGFSKDHANELRAKIGEILSIQPEKVMLCFSHTHAAPNEDIEPAYRICLYSKICDCVQNARRNMKPVYGGWGITQADIGFNRRKDSSALDKRIGILKITAADTETPCLILLRLTAHANVLKRDNYLISPDFFGTVRNYLKEKYHCPVVVTQGAAGNVAPRFVASALILPDACDDRVIRSASALDEMAKEIDSQVEQVFKDIPARPVQSLSMYSRYIDLYADVPDYHTAQKIAAQAQQEAGINGTSWLKEVQSLLKNAVREQKDTTEVQFFTLGNGCLCGVPNELMCEFALKVWQKTQNPYCFFGGYTNGCTGYFPTEEEFDLGGYEVYWSMLLYYRYHGRVFPLRRNSATQLIDFVVQNLPR